jgi:outer membrane protein assembly factor BamE (lipoprotein component of BamABCDE complex)
MRTLKLIVGLVVLAVVAFAFLRYSWAWSEKFLAPVHVGMTKSQIQSLLGAARHIRTNAEAEVWDYTRSWSRDTRVYFDANGIVSGIETD